MCVYMVGLLFNGGSGSPSTSRKEGRRKGEEGKEARKEGKKNLFFIIIIISYIISC